MDKETETYADHKSLLLSSKKNMDKRWENELSQWMIEEFYTPYQAS
jgi:hypothetical protein